MFDLTHKKIFILKKISMSRPIPSLKSFNSYCSYILYYFVILLETYPIVLCKGIAPFDILWRYIFQTERWKLFEGLNYWSGIKPFLESKGFVVEHTNVGFAHSQKKRAQVYLNI